MKCNSTESQERAQQLWRELDGLDWSSHELAIVGILRDALDAAAMTGEPMRAERPDDPVKCGCSEFPECTHALYWYQGFKAGEAHPRAALSSGSGQHGAPLCETCGKPENDDRHIRYDRDLDNPVKHQFVRAALAIYDIGIGDAAWCIAQEARDKNWTVEVLAPKIAQFAIDTAKEAIPLRAADAQQPSGSVEVSGPACSCHVTDGVTGDHCPVHGRPAQGNILTGYELAGCADRAKVIVYRMGDTEGVPTSRHMMMPTDWNRFADEVKALKTEVTWEGTCFTCEGEQGLPATRSVLICEKCFGDDDAARPAQTEREEVQDVTKQLRAKALDVIRHARTNEPHDDWSDWQNAILNGLLSAYNLGVDSVQERQSRLTGLVNEAVKEAAMNFERSNDDPPVRLYFCSLCTTAEGCEADTWEEVKHTPECIVSRVEAALSATPAQPAAGPVEKETK